MTPESTGNIYSLHPAIEEISVVLSQKASKVCLKGLAGSSGALFFSALAKQKDFQLLIVLNDREEAAYFYDDLSLVAGDNKILFFPSSYKRSLKYGKVVQENIVIRTEVLNKISGKGSHIIVTYPEALSEKVITGKTLQSNTLQINTNDKLSIEFITDVLHEYGFERADFVYEPGQYSQRGGIIDIYSYAHDEPFRIDFFGNEVESIRSFDIETQLSKKKFDSVSIIPDIQLGLKNADRISFLDFLPQNFALAFRDIGFTIDQLNQLYHDANNTQTEAENNSDLFAGGDQISNHANNRCFIEFGTSCFFKNAKTIEFKTIPQPAFNKNFDLLAQDMKLNISNGYENFILSNSEKQIERLKEIFDDRALNVKFIPLNFTLHEGFIDRELKKAFYTDHQIFERYHRYKHLKTTSARETISLKELGKLHPGDFVVHIDHGIGKFAGLVKTEINGKIQEAVRLVYKDNDSLLVNIQSLHRIAKYKGKDGTEPAISKLGTGAWQKMKNRAKSKVKDIARELIALYAERLKEKGFSFSPDSYLQQELEASFMYEDTPDQYKATQDVKEDMEQAMPMDRLVCGDVGFGKTEVAIRAAFKAVTDSKQVAVLVPTTILALQHYNTFSERLNNFPATVSYVSRLRSSAKIKETLKDLLAGKVDIIIGTHRLVGKDVKFKDLGLLIIDEEQKFGVSVKEKLKKLKVNVDTLTLTATPIPRTLQFSLMGARDLSVIQTPPPNRYPIVTEVPGFNEEVIREAINYELDRDGQVFFIHNRVQNIHEVENFVKKACPEAKVIVGHGQMEGAKLEKVMLDFISGKYDVLIATTIIENGLDIPNANTIIINHAQTFGLSDLHQLRGRVGRSNKKAFCYLLAPPVSTLSPEARRRLKAIEEFSELGSGFNIAMHDLDIRGAGNLLGAEQSGFIADIGYETYHRILNEAVLELKQEEFKEIFEMHETEGASKAFLNLKYVNDCSIETDMELHFPENYINSTTERMTLYRDLDNIENEEELKKFEYQLNDRFGKIPDRARDLLEIVRLRWAAIDLGMERIVLKNGKMICHFIGNQQSPFYRSPEFAKIISWVQANPGKCRMKESTEKLSMVFEKVKSVGIAKDVLSGLLRDN
ncbi:MAG: transcription-repair coupling factor [Prolixibacteraceae bacterium]|nr:transcription-repair coupling factor [Prolixibacteraceae bacterium]